MKKLTLIITGAIALILVGCTTMTTSMQETNSRVQFVKTDYEFSETLTGEATQVKIFGLLDLARIFNKEYGEIQVVGGPTGQAMLSSFLGASVNQYALYSIMKENPQYDIVFYPKYDVEKNNLIFVTVTKVKATAKMAKLKTK